MQIHRTAMQLFSAAAFVVTGLAAGPVFSADGDAADLLDEIVVTVRKREESLMTVPISIATLTGKQMIEMGVDDLFGIAAFTPNVAFQDFGNGQLGIPTIRGMGQTMVLADDKNVGIFVNGIFISDENAFDIDMLDIERVEMSRGPQSSQYGRNTFAGAINFVPAGATDEFAGKVLGSAGSDEYYEISGFVGGPIGDKFGARVAAGYKTFDGTYDNAADSSDNLKGWETWNISTTLNLDLTEKFSATLFAYYLEDENEQTANYLLENNCGARANNGQPAYFCGDLPTKEGSQLGVDGAGISPEGFGAQREALIGSLNLESHIGRLTLSWLTGYVDSTNDMTFDSDMSNGYPFAIGNDFNGPPCPGPFPPFFCGVQSDTLLTDQFTTFEGDTEDWSSEFRVAFDGGRYRFMLGGFWYDHELTRKSLLGINGGGSKEMMPAGFNFTNPGAFLFATSDPVNNPIPAQGFTQTTEDLAVFGSFEFDFTERLTLSLEGRYTDEEKSIVRDGSPIFGPGSMDKESWDFFTPRVILDYSQQDNEEFQWMTYASIAKGVHAGGFNASFNADLPSESSYDPEENWTYEIGFKGGFVPYGDAFMNVGVALFYVDWSDMQLASLSELGGLANPTRNAGEAEVFGLELTINTTLSRYFDLNLAYGYADPEITEGTENRLAEFCGPDICVIDPDTGQVIVDGNQLGRTHKHSFSATGIVHGPLGMSWGGGDWEWYTRADYSYLSEAPSRLLNVQYIPERSLVNARAAIHNNSFEFALWATNLFDEGYVTGQSHEPRQTNSGGFDNFTMRTTAGFQGDGRIVGGSVIYHF